MIDPWYNMDEPQRCSKEISLWINMHDSTYMRYLTSLVAHTVKRLSTMRETRVQSLGREDLLEKEMATHSSTTVWKIPWTEEPGRLHVVHEVAKSRTRLSNFTYLRFYLIYLIKI